MYHLIFSSSKHKKSTNYWSRSSYRVNRASTHNQFELDTIRGSMKSRWSLHGAGEKTFQRLLWQVEERANVEVPPGLLHKYMNGHIVTVDTAVDMMWFRLNHENVSKNGCKMVEIYRDLDEEKLGEMVQLFNLRYDELNIRMSLNSYLVQSQTQLSRFINHKDVKAQEQWYIPSFKLSQDLGEFRESHESEITKIKSEMTRLSKKIFAFVEEHRTEIA